MLVFVYFLLFINKNRPEILHQTGLLNFIEIDQKYLIEGIQIYENSTKEKKKLELYHFDDLLKQNFMAKFKFMTINVFEESSKLNLRA
jgi:hypothetical protein